MPRFIFAALCAFPLFGRALEFAPAFSDHMVLQASRPFPITGRAGAGAHVEVTVSGQVLPGQADGSGHWQVECPSLSPTYADTGGEVTVKSGGQTVVLHDVLVGEVWLCSGQSNMRFTLSRNYVQPDTKTPSLFPEELKSAGRPRIRLLSVSGGTPANRRWAACAAETAAGFSALGYFFGNALQGALKDCPIGLIDLGKGGEPIRGFLAKDLIQSTPELRDSIPPLAPNRPDPTGEVYRSDLLWLAPFPIRGILWYQGESEVSRSKDYPAWMTALINEWRHDLNSPEAAFLIVQLPVYERHRTDPVPKVPGVHWAELRAVQLQLADTLPGVALTPALDLGEQFDIHPHRKPELGMRLAKLAEKVVYKLPVAAEAPRLLSARRVDRTCILTFSHAEGGIVATREALANLECGTSDGKYVAADGRVTGNDSVTVQLPADIDTTMVRYGWRDFFVPDLFNGESLPVIPFSAEIK